MKTVMIGAGIGALAGVIQLVCFEVLACINSMLIRRLSGWQSSPFQASV